MATDSGFKFTLSSPIAQVVIGLVQQLGVPATALAIVLYLVGWKFGPPIVDGHLEVLQTTSRTLEANSDTLTKMGDTLNQMASSQDKMVDAQGELTESVARLNDGITEIIKVERDSQEFMDKVSREHIEHTEAIRDVDTGVQDVLKHVKPNGG